MEIDSTIDARIDEIRKGDIIVKTRPGAEVNICQVRHEFLFGTAITNSLAEKAGAAMTDEDRAMFLKILGENFNNAVHENALKWYCCELKEHEVDYYMADRIWEMCNDLNIPMRGHCIFWAKDIYNLPWVHNLNNDQLRQAVMRRAIDVTKHFRGRSLACLQAWLLRVLESLDSFVVHILKASKKQINRKRTADTRKCTQIRNFD